MRACSGGTGGEGADLGPHSRVNAAECLVQSVQSAMAQSWPHKEVVIVDDGSADDTRNRALALSQGDFIQWLDADDLLAPDKVEGSASPAGGSEVERRSVKRGETGVGE
jgi:Glycosyl transferase family 2